MPQTAPPTYIQATAELRQIVDRLRNADEVDVDELMGEVDRAKQLIDFCGAKIKKAEVHVRSVLDELAAEEGQTTP